MILSISHIAKSYGVDSILEDVTFNVEEDEKVAIVGVNGAGKSTVLKIIVNEIKEDSGEISFKKNIKVGYLSQISECDSNATIIEEVTHAKDELIGLEAELKSMESKMSSVKEDDLSDFMDKYHRLNEEFENKGGYTYKGEIVSVIRGLGFADDEFDKKISTLSGGQKTRVTLAKILLMNPDLLLLDEPTNHLDIKAIEWLENYLKSYKGAVVIVSHDRYFLDKIVTKVVEIEFKKSSVYTGTFTEYTKKKEQKRIDYLKHYFEQQKYIKREEEIIRNYRSHATESEIIKAKSREKRLEHLERLEKPMEVSADMRFSISPAIESGKDVLSIRSLSMGFNDNVLFNDVNIDIKKGERVAIIGGNGTGKTTLLKVLNEVYKPLSGDFKLGTNVEIGYYDQEQQNFNEDNTIFDEIGDAYPNLTNTKIRNILGAFLFTNDDVFKKISSLSGGERGRVALAKLMLSNANLLILDEPTNHLDINSKEILETSLNNYTGTILFVSHDRFFINRVATRVLELENKRFTNYLGNYDYYVEKKTENAVIKTENAVIPKQSAGADSYKQQKEEERIKRKKENEIKKTEERIEELEGKIKDVDEKLSDPSIASNSARLNELTNERSGFEDELNALYEKWEELTNEL
ncbi:MAG: ABC-F family ATP-binding cassette domain-containing protein [Lachnospiraceae bacterium]|nr:ABC-F family ATP-binding cassette domain-containing protein [Lachnospiraceae bacterium]